MQSLSEGNINYNGLSLAAIVSYNYKAAAIFEKFNIDFCYEGEKTISEACKEKGIEAEKVFSELENIDSNKVEIPVRVDDWELDIIVDYIINNHHKYVRNMIPVITTHTEKAASLQGKEHPEIIEAAKTFSSVYKELKQHMMKEEEILFPYIKYLVQVKNREIKYEKPYFGKIGNPINMLELEHQSAGEDMYKIRKLTNNYTPPKDASEAYILCLKELKEFEEDHHKHVHLENHLLFPKSVLLEEQLLSEIINRPN